MEIYHPRDEELLREMRRVRRSNKRRRLLWGLLISLLLCAAAGFVVFHWVYALHWVSGSAMGDTLPSGSLVLVRRSPAEGYARGDLALYYKEEIPSVKRILALGGDNVVISPYTEHELRVDGQYLEEPYAVGRAVDAGVVTRRLSVPEGEVFVAGDQRTLSVDSRFRDYGTIPTADVLGRVDVILWPLSRFGMTREGDIASLLTPILNLNEGATPVTPVGQGVSPQSSSEDQGVSE